MAVQANGAFTVLSWDESTYEDLDGGAKLTRARVTFGYSGDLEAEGSWETLMCYRDDGTAVFTGLQHAVGSLGGRKGSFVLRADGAFADGEARTSWQVIPGSATGELRGLSGSGSAVSTGGSGGTFAFDYEIG
jgi:Protein of unknown function (DUF3224)